jgi:ribosomal protein L37AE/L43A
MKITCEKHPRYEGKRKPRNINGCSECWEVWRDGPYNPESKNYNNFEDYFKEMNKEILKEYQF